MAGCVGPCSGGLWTSLRMNCSGRDVYMNWFPLFREAVDKSQDEVQWQVDLEDEVEEAREEHADEYARKMLLYKEQMEKWEKQQEAKVRGQRVPKGVGRSVSLCDGKKKVFRVINSVHVHSVHCALFSQPCACVMIKQVSIL